MDDNPKRVQLKITSSQEIHALEELQRISSGKAQQIMMEASNSKKCPNYQLVPKKKCPFLLNLQTKCLLQ
jgi:hypothetical protein